MYHRDAEEKEEKETTKKKTGINGGVIAHRLYPGGDGRNGEALLR